ncbi:hypothetical protein EDD16DRAFT_1728500 [Pisolithus croceorrhizus]|nr:hypothetical protein EDD16DRAFT_1728500 [Pisolithus croceorrhizus]
MLVAQRAVYNGLPSEDGGGMKSPDIVQQIASSVSNLLRRSCRYGMLRLARHVWELLGYVSTRAVRDDPRLPAAENKSGEECAREIAELATKNASEAAHVAEEAKKNLEQSKP